MKQVRLLVLLFLVIFSACKHPADEATPSGPVLKQKTTIQEEPQGAALQKAKIDNYVLQTIQNNHDFHWDWMDLRTIWSILQYGDHSLAIGYKPADAGDILPEIHKVDVHRGAYKAVHDSLIAFIQQGLKESGSTSTWNDILVEDDPILPIITIRLTDKTVLTRLANLENVRYLEPLDYWPDANRSSSGCNSSTQTLNGADWTTITPNARLPWNFNNLNIPAAWTTSEGQGMTIGIIDGGISSTQTLLGTMFNDGLSNVGRSITTDYTLGTSAYTSCTHGTSMCGQAVGPRNNQFATTGVAYKANLHFIRSCDDVVLDASAELTGTKNALIKMGDHPTVKIISMSIGTPFSSSLLKDGCTYAYNKGKVIFAAAGTSYSWTSWWGVIYPAAYTTCVAITGVNESSSTCVDCHDGSQVMFTVPMERNANTARNSLSLSPSGYTPTYIGGSSCATSTSAGIAALVWAARPNMTRDQLLTCMRSTAQYTTKTSAHGYGNLNAGAAVAYAVAHY